MLKEMNRLVDVIKEEYPNLYVDLEYDEEENLYEIWYNNEELRTDKKFGEFIGKLVYELYNKDIFNFYIDYNEDRTNEIDDYLNSLQEHLVFENLENLFDIIIEENNEELDILNDAIESEDHLKENFQYETNDRNNEDFINNLMKKVNIGNHPDKCTYVEAA